MTVAARAARRPHSEAWLRVRNKDTRGAPGCLAARRLRRIAMQLDDEAVQYFKLAADSGNGEALYRADQRRAARARARYAAARAMARRACWRASIRQELERLIAPN